MGRRRGRRTGRPDQGARRLLAGLLTSLLLLTLIVVAVAATGTYNKSKSTNVTTLETSLRSGDTTTETQTAGPGAQASETVQAIDEPGGSAPEPTPAPDTSLPSQMAHLPSDCSQLVVITGKKIGSRSGTLEVYNLEGGRWTSVLKTKANFGNNGLIDGKKRRQGHLETPTGIWSIGNFVFGLHRSAPTATKMPYRRITQNSWWSSERNSTYNTWVESKSHVSGEHLADADPQYEYAFNTGYNSPPNERVMGRGTAIFVHCFEPPGNALGQFTHGCIAVAPERMIDLFRILDPTRKPYCAIGTLRKGSATSIWAY